MSLTRTALIIVDPQYDFGNPKGALYVPCGEDVVPEINRLRARLRAIDVKDVFLTQDWHPSNHMSFVSNNPGTEVNDTILIADGSLQTMWPPHCIQGTLGAEFLAGLDREPSDIVIQKGTSPLVDAYSGFGSVDGLKSVTTLMEYLCSKNITRLVIVGLAFDYCVAYTARDAASFGFRTCVVRSATRGISEETSKTEENLMFIKGVTIAETIDDACDWVIRNSPI